MDLSNCQRCKKSYDLFEKRPKILNCDCIVCAECIKIGLDYDEQFICNIHKQIFKGQISDLKNLNDTQEFEESIKNFEKEAKLKQNLQNIQQFCNTQQLQYINYQKAVITTLKFFSSIIKQACHQASINICENLQSRIKYTSEIIQNLRNYDEILEKIQLLKSETYQQHQERVNLFNQVQQQYEQIKQKITDFNFSEQEALDKNNIAQWLTKRCFKVLQFIQSIAQNKILDQQNVVDSVNEYLKQKKKYDFMIITRENVKQFIQKFQNQLVDGSEMKDNPLNQSNISYDYDILNQFDQHQSQSLIQKLNEVVIISKTYNQVEQASANAITILNHLKYNFLQKNYDGIRIRGADLCEASFQDCYFKNANLKEVNLTNSRFINCKFNRADLTNVQIESPETLDTLQGHTSYVYSIAISSDKK